MPSSPTPICNRPEIKIQSTGQAGPEVNRDLEVLFSNVNGILRCVAKLASFADSLSAGGFGPGNGTAGSIDPNSGGNLGRQGQAPGFNPPLRIASGSDFTINEAFFGTVMVDPTADIAITLCTPVSGWPITIVHVGA